MNDLADIDTNGFKHGMFHQGVTKDIKSTTILRSQER
jgi:hypothetical protein